MSVGSRSLQPGSKIWWNVRLKPGGCRSSRNNAHTSRRRGSDITCGCDVWMSGWLALVFTWLSPSLRGDPQPQPSTSSLIVSILKLNLKDIITVNKDTNEVICSLLQVLNVTAAACLATLPMFIHLCRILIHSVHQKHHLRQP